MTLPVLFEVLKHLKKVYFLWKLVDAILHYTANWITVDIDNGQTYDLGDKKDGNNHSFIHEDATSIMLNTIFVILQGHWCVGRWAYLKQYFLTILWAFILLIWLLSMSTLIQLAVYNHTQSDQKCRLKF